MDRHSVGGILLKILSTYTTLAILFDREDRKDRNLEHDQTKTTDFSNEESFSQ